MKGSLVEILISIIIGIIILIIVMPIINRAAMKIWNYLGEKWGGIVGKEFSAIEKAMICSNLICNLRYDRSKEGCPYQVPGFGEFCAKWLEENGLIQEVCTLPSLFKIDPCYTFSFPIVVNVKSEKDGNFEVKDIKDKIYEYEKKEIELDSIKEKNNYDSNIGYLLSFLASAPFFAAEEEYNQRVLWGYVNSIIVPNQFLSYREPERGNIIEKGKLTQGKYYIFTYRDERKDEMCVDPLGHPTLCLYVGFGTLVSKKPEYISISSKNNVVRLSISLMRGWEMTDPFEIISKYYFRIFIEDEYDVKRPERANYFIRFVSKTDRSLTIEFLAYYVESIDPNALGLVKQTNTLMLFGNLKYLTNVGILEIKLVELIPNVRATIEIIYYKS